jgi:hypothetical protein
LNPAHTFISCFFKIHFIASSHLCLGPRGVSSLQIFQIKFCMHFLSPHAYYMHHKSHCPWFCHHRNFLQRYKLWSSMLMQVSHLPVSSSLLSLNILLNTLLSHHIYKIQNQIFWCA